MKRMIKDRRLILLSVLFLVLTVSCHAQKQEKIQDSGLYNPQLDYIQFFNRTALQAFSDKWAASDSQITIAHFGDSHVQPDIYTGELRRELQEIKGYGGLGMLFPFSTARTYATKYYSSSHTGQWLSAKSLEYRPKLPLGISGATARTVDARASFTLTFKCELPADYRKLRIYCLQSTDSYDMDILSDGVEIPVLVDTTSRVPIEVTLPSAPTFITIKLSKRHSCQDEFEFYGMSLESLHPKGLILHNLGIGGSQFNAPLKEVYLPEQMKCIHADLIVLDYGTNDILYDNRVPADMEEQIRKVISGFRHCDPNATILLTSAQDMCRHGSCITAGRDFSALIKKIAKEENCPFFDWYWVSGGPGTSLQWQDSGYMRKDGIHLTEKGYLLKGYLLANALTRTLSLFEQHKAPDSLILNTDTLARQRQTALDSLTRVGSFAATYTPHPAKGRSKGHHRKQITYHKVKRGETLAVIARKYNVPASQLKKANHLRSNQVTAGRTLKVPFGY